MVTAQNYYQQNKAKYLKQFSNLLLATEQILSIKFPADELKILLSEMQSAFLSLIAKIPYIGGKQNELTQNLVVCAEYLAIYQVLKKHDLSLTQIARIIPQIAKLQLEQMPWLNKITMRFFWRMMFTKWFKKQMQKSAAISQQRKFKDDFVYTFVAGDGKNFNFGFDFTECAICKFFQQENASEFVPIMCELDYVISDFVKVKLNRTTTLANRGSCCDFRYNKG